MTQCLITSSAAIEIASILERSQRMFGDLASVPYEELICQGIRDLCADPSGVGSIATPQIDIGCFVYHLKQSRTHVSKSVGRVHLPRHFLLCRITNNDVLEILRVIHDSMSLNTALLVDP